MNLPFRPAILMMAAVLLSLAGCRQAVTYKITQEGRQVTRHFPMTLRVALLKDEAPKHPSINLSMGKQRWKANALDAYKDKEYVRGISKMIAQDLASSGLFTQVLPPDGANAAADYELRGTVWDFSAVGKWKIAPENVVIFSSVFLNLPGALISAMSTRWVKTEVVSSVILTNLQIVDLRNGKTLWTCPPLRAGGVETVRWSQADVGPLVKLANRDLQQVVTQLINRLNDAKLGGGPH